MVKLEEKKSRLTTTLFGAASLQYSLFARESRSTKNHIHRGEHKRYRERNESNRIYAYIQSLALWFNVCLSVDKCVCECMRPVVQNGAVPLHTTCILHKIHYK